MAERARGPQEKDYIRRRFLYLGNTYPIQISQDVSIEQDNAILKDKLHIYVKELKDEKIQQALKRFYYKQCKTLVEKSIKVHQSNFKTKPRSIRITDSSRTWVLGFEFTTNIQLEASNGTTASN